MKSLNLSFVVFVISCRVFHSFCQDIEITTPTTVPLQPPLCDSCECSDDTVDCSSRDMTALFTIEDWGDLQSSVLDLSSNQLKTLPQFPALPIQMVNLSNCQMSKIKDGAFSQLVNITSIDLSFNQLSTSALTRGLFQNMARMGLSNNEIHSLSQDIFVFMRTLTYLDLSNNPLAYIDQVTMAALSDLVDLKELYLNGCELESLPEGLLRRQRRLETLHITNNRFTTIPSVLNEATNLKFLDLGKNPIASIEGTSTLSSLTKLQELHLCSLSKLQTIGPSALGGLTGLKVLRICSNPRLTTLDKTFLMWEDEDDGEMWPELTELYLNNNNLSVIDSHILGSWDIVTKLNVDNNPYLCDCSVEWMVNILLPMLENISDGSEVNMVCKHPPEQKGLTFKYLYESKKNLKCKKSDTLITAADVEGIIFLGITIGVFVTFPAVLIVMLLWKRGYFRKCRRRMERDHAEEELYHLRYY